LFEIDGQGLFQRSVEDGIAGGVGEVGEDAVVLLGQAVRGLARPIVKRDPLPQWNEPMLSTTGAQEQA
jgi:hypothetical protein